MPTHTIIPFEKRYQSALWLYLTQQSSKPSDKALAHVLGCEAVALGLDRLDIVHMHARAMVSLDFAPAVPLAKETVNHQARATVFLKKILVPMAQAQRQARKAVGQVEHLTEHMREHTIAQTALRKQMQQEITCRKKLEAKLVQAAEHYSELLVQSRHAEEQSRRLAHQVLLEQEAERKEISRELHDEIAQMLAGVNVQLAALKEVANIDGRVLRKRIIQTQRLVGRSVNIVHRFARALRPAMLDDLGLIPTLRSYINELPYRKGLRIHFTSCREVEDLNNPRRTVLYRVAQEALTNVVCHAHAQLATVRIRKVRDVVRLEVHDDGKSFDVKRAFDDKVENHLGLLGMKERVEMVGGEFSITSTLGKGTTVRADIPFRKKTRTKAS